MFILAFKSLSCFSTHLQVHSLSESFKFWFIQPQQLQVLIHTNFKFSWMVKLIVWCYGKDQVKMTTGKDKEDYYVLSNGETYEVDDLAVGLDEIRDWKLKNNLNI